MNKSEEVEYCNLELRFDRRHIQELIQEGYSLYWSENEAQFVISIRTGRKLVKLKFQRTGSGFKLVGDYMIRDPKLAEWMEKLIENTRGHAVVKRFKDRQILIENILFGEVIRLVEISGYRQRVLYQKGTPMTEQEMIRLYESQEGEQRLLLCRLETDDELEKLHEAVQSGNDKAAAACKKRLEELSLELFRMEW